jgi:TonB family protein
MVAKRIAGRPEADPEAFVGPAPEYPASLAKVKGHGKAVVPVRVGADGRIHDPVIKTATDPAFGEAALAAVRLWRFLPRIQGGHPVESKVDMPFEFAPPS